MPWWATQIPLQDQTLITLSSQPSPSLANSAAENCLVKGPIPSQNECQSVMGTKAYCMVQTPSADTSERQSLLWGLCWDNTGAQPFPLPNPDSFPPPQVVCVHVLSHFSRVWLCATLWTVACQAPLSMEFSRLEYWSGLTFPSPGDLPNPGIEPASLASHALTGWFFTTSATWEAQAALHRAIPDEPPKPKSPPPSWLPGKPA